MKNIIEIENLSKCYGDFTAVNHISFQVKKGELFAFLGTNGAGKSTTINMICSLLTKTSGKIIVSGFDMDCEAEKIRSCLGIVFQNNVLDDLLTVKENLTIRAKLRGLCGVELNTCIKELKENFDLFDIWKRPDPQTRTAIWSLIRNMQEKYGMTVFLTTHYMEEAAAADHVVILEKGSIQAEGTLDALKSQYGKDSLKLWFDYLDKGADQLKVMGYLPKLKTDHLLISVNSSQEALRVLENIKDFKDFELIKGTMDDVFLEVTRHTEVELCKK